MENLINSIINLKQKVWFISPEDFKKEIQNCIDMMDQNVKDIFLKIIIDVYETKIILSGENIFSIIDGKYQKAKSSHVGGWYEAQAEASYQTCEKWNYVIDKLIKEIYIR